MKIRLEAFDKLYSGIMEIPEETGLEFSLVLKQPIQVAKWEQGIPSFKPLEKRARFSFSGYFDAGDERDVKIYKLVDIN